ncbi:TrmH family RNA methyltransferase [Leucobacter chinensis]|uniref:TrmH family RNA methyltransferase n=1 Tax=Leucobacter chinensis TaxID=2851010 RepID=UPI00350F0A73
MNHDILDNPKAPRIKRLAQLLTKKQRVITGTFLVEGPQAVEELLAHRPAEAETVFVRYDGSGFPNIERLAEEQGVEVLLATPQVIAALSDTVTPQGVVAVARMAEADLVSVLKDAKLVAIMHEVRDPGNAGTVLRAADAAGADAVVFAGESIDPWNPKVVRSTTGSLFHLPVVTGVTLEEAIDAATASGLTTIAADVRGDDLSPSDESLAGPVAWVFGNEAHGLSEADRARAERSLRLPIFGAAESLNLATAASVCLYTTAFAQRQAR